MSVKRLLLASVVIVALLLAGQQPLTVYSQDHDHNAPLDAETMRLIDDVRGAVAPFRDLDTALESGYGIFQDCFKDDKIGGMGQHYISGELVGDDAADPLRPEALVYEPREDGSLILVALEYLIFKEAWDAKHDPDQAPVLFGQEFHLKTTIKDTPPVWTLHIWLFTHNPEGLFADYNPLVFCPAILPSSKSNPM